MTWLKSKFYKEAGNYFETILENNDDVEIIREVLDMEIHSENGGEFISNLLSDMDRRGLSPESHQQVIYFDLEWKRSTASHFKFKSPNLNYQDFLDSIRTA